MLARREFSGFALSILIIVLPLAIAGCVGPEPTATPPAGDVSIAGPACPQGFEEEQLVTREVAVAPSTTVTLTLGSTPSIPCSWQAPEISDDTVLRQAEHTTEWPAEDVTPMPGAPGTDVWVLEALEEGESAWSVECRCLGEEGTGETLRGTFELQVVVE